MREAPVSDRRRPPGGPVQAAIELPSGRPELDGLLAEIFATPEGRREPYSRYKTLREQAPVYKSVLGIVTCTSFDDCQFVLRDPRFGKEDRSDPEDAARRRFGPGVITDEQARWLGERRSMLFMNPPDHTRLRGLVTQAFTPRTVETLKPQIALLVERLLDEVEEKAAGAEPVDMMEAVAFRLPVSVIGRMLGVPEEDWTRFQHSVRTAVALLEPMVAAEELSEAFAAQMELEAYFEALVAERRVSPGDDLLSHLIGVEEGSDRLSEAELISTAILLFGAGFETTTNLIGNGLLALLRHPDELRRLRERPDLVRSGVEELLRFDSPVQIDSRVARRDLVVGGCRVEDGTPVVTFIGAANHDPLRFHDPDRLDVARDEGPALAFGSGIHFCLGAALARAEGQAVFGALLQRFGSMELAEGEPNYRNRITIRGLAELPVVFSPPDGAAGRGPGGLSSS